jgi:hypothetical protein
MPPKTYSKEKFVSTAKAVSVADDKGPFRQGVLSETLVQTEHSVGFQFAFEYEIQVPQIEGTPVAVKTYRTVPVVFVDSGVALIGFSKKEEEERVVRFLEANFVRNTILRTIKFEQNLLRKVVDKYPEVAQVDVVPSTEKGIDKLSAYGRDVTDSLFWSEHEGDELLKVKAPLSDLQEPAMVGFKENGVVTLYQRGLEFPQQIEVLSYVATNILAPYSRELAVQTKLWVT